MCSKSVDGPQSISGPSYILLATWSCIMVHTRFLIIHGPWLTYHSILEPYLQSLWFHHSFRTNIGRVYGNGASFIGSSIQDGFQLNSQTQLCIDIIYQPTERSNKAVESVGECISIIDTNNFYSKPEISVAQIQPMSTSWGNTVDHGSPSSTYKIHLHGPIGIKKKKATARKHCPPFNRSGHIASSKGRFTADTMSI